MDAQSIINDVGILEAFEGGAASVTDVADSCSESRSTVYRFISDAEDWCLLTTSSDEYTLTAAGMLVLREYRSLEDHEREAVSTVARFEYGFRLLEILDSSVVSKAEMTRRSGASRSTVQRIIEAFGEGTANDDGWLEEPDGGFTLNSAGKRVLSTHLDFTNTIAVVDDKIEFLERYVNTDQLPPIEALDNSRLVVSTVTDNNNVVRELKRIDFDGITEFRGISQAFSGQLSDYYIANFPEDVDSRLIIDRNVYVAITHPKRWKYLFNINEWPNFTLRVHPDDVKVGLGLYDEQAVIAGYSEAKPFNAALFSTNDVFYDWVERVYESYDQDALSPGKDLLRWGSSEIIG